VEAIAMLAKDGVAHFPEKFAVRASHEILSSKIVLIRTSKDIITISPGAV
jgi:hypothetical protein